MRVAALIICGVIGIGILALVGCAKQQETEVTGSTNAAATPGSQQDFVVNVGDRVFFQTDLPSSPHRHGSHWINRPCG